MWKLESLKHLLRKPSVLKVSGVSILLLQGRLDRFTSEQLSIAMKRGWRKEYDPMTFFATSLMDGEGAVIKFNSMFIGIEHFDRRIDGQLLGSQSLPSWAMHSAYSSITYACPGGIPAGESRDRFYGFLGLLCAELISDSTSGLLFTEEQVLVRNCALLLQALRSGASVNPRRLAASVESNLPYRSPGAPS